MNALPGAMEQWVIYANTRDYPGSFVVRRWQVARGEMYKDVVPTGVVATLEEARALVPIDCVCLPAHADDDPVVVEVWI